MSPWGAGYWRYGREGGGVGMSPWGAGYWRYGREGGGGVGMSPWGAGYWRYGRQGHEQWIQSSHIPPCHRHMVIVWPGGGGGILGHHAIPSLQQLLKDKCCHGVSLGCKKGAEQGPKT